jgi:hypothetical protein
MAAKLGAVMPAMLQLKPKQCLVIVDEDFLSTSTSLWLNNLYVRVLRRTPDSSMYLLRVYDFASPSDTSKVQKPALWMSNVTLQGDDGDCSGMSVDTQVYAQGAQALSVDVPTCCTRFHSHLAAAWLVCTACVDRALELSYAF